MAFELDANGDSGRVEDVIHSTRPELFYGLTLVPFARGVLGVDGFVLSWTAFDPVVVAAGWKICNYCKVPPEASD